MCQTIVSKYPSQEQLKAMLEYNPHTGFFVWLENNRTKSQSHKKFHSARFEGKVAGTKASVGLKSYIKINAAGFKAPLYAHRLAFIYMTGEMPEHVDHINGNGCDNRWENLRWSDKSDNSRNVKRSSSNTSGVTGVGWNKRQKCWRAYIKVDGKMISLGNHSDKQKAIEARVSAEILYGFREGHGSDRPYF